jgi:hypothetical protein
MRREIREYRHSNRKIFVFAKRSPGRTAGDPLQAQKRASQDRESSLAKEVIYLVSMVTATIVAIVFTMPLPAPSGFAAVIPASMLSFMPAVMISVIAPPSRFTGLGLGSHYEHTKTDGYSSQCYSNLFQHDDFESPLRDVLGKYLKNKATWM